MTASPLERVRRQAVIEQAKAEALTAAAEGLRAASPPNPVGYIQAIADAHTHCAERLSAIADGEDPMTYSLKGSET